MPQSTSKQVQAACYGVSRYNLQLVKQSPLTTVDKWSFSRRQESCKTLERPWPWPEVQLFQLICLIT